MSSAMVTSMVTHESSDYEAQQRFSRALKTARSSSFREKRVGGRAMNRSNSARIEQLQTEPAARKSPPAGSGEERSSSQKNPPQSIGGGEDQFSFRKMAPPSNEGGGRQSVRRVQSSMNSSEKVRSSTQRSRPTGYGGELRNARKKAPPRTMSLNDHRYHHGPRSLEQARGSGGPSPMNRRVDAYRRELGRSTFGTAPRMRSAGSASTDLSSSYHSSRAEAAVASSDMQDLSSSYHGRAVPQPGSSTQQRRSSLHNSSNESYRGQQQQRHHRMGSWSANPEDDQRYGVSHHVMQEEDMYEESEDKFDRKMPVSEPARDANNMIEIFPGNSVPLRTTEETMAAVKRNAYQDAPCVACGKELFCISDASYCICPTCKSISPLEDRGRAEGMRYGLGLGFTFDTLSRMREEIMSRK